MVPRVLRRMVFPLCQIISCWKKNFATIWQKFYFLAKPLTNPFHIPYYLLIQSDRITPLGREAKELSFFSAWAGSFALFCWQELHPNLGHCPRSPSGSSASICHHHQKWERCWKYLNYTCFPPSRIFCARGAAHPALLQQREGKLKSLANQSPSSTAGERELMLQSEQFSSWYHLHAAGCHEETADITDVQLHTEDLNM